ENRKYLNAGDLIFQYNWFHDFPGDVLSIIGECNLDFRYNLIVRGAMQPGAHLNYLMFSSAGTTSSATVEFNTSYQEPGVSGGEGYQFYCWGGGCYLSSPTFAYNTMIASPISTIASPRQNNHAYSVGDMITVGNNVSNYYACTRAGTSGPSQ